MSKNGPKSQIRPPLGDLIKISLTVDYIIYRPQVLSFKLWAQFIQGPKSRVRPRLNKIRPVGFSKADKQRKYPAQLVVVLSAGSGFFRG